MKKVTSLALHTGFAETASRAAVVLVHKTGFDSVQEACASVRAAILKDIERHNRSYEVQHKYLEPLPANCEGMESYLREYIASVNNDGFYEFEEFLAKDGWLTFPDAICRVDKKRLVVITSSEFLIPKAGSWKIHHGDEWLDGEINTENLWLPNKYDRASARARRRFIIGA